MLLVFIRSSIIFITLLLIMRLMGKRQIGEMQPFELVITLVIAELACIPMSDVSIPLVYGIVAILALFILHQIVALLEGGGLLFKRLISGRPSIVLTPKGVDIKELKKNNLNVEDLIETMRSVGYFSFDELDFGIFETNGKFSALQKQNAKKSETLSFLLVNNGKLASKNLNNLNLTKADIINLIGDTKLKNVEILTISLDNKIYLQEKGENYKTFTKNILKKGVGV